MNQAERAQASTLVREVELAIRTLMSHLTHDAYVQRWDKGSPAIRALNILQEAVGEPPTAGEKPQDTVNYDVELIESIREQRRAYEPLDRQATLGLALSAATRLEQRTSEVLQAQVYTEYWIDKANSLQEQLNESHDIEEDLLARLREQQAAVERGRSYWNNPTATELYPEIIEKAIKGETA